jgi:hypothetical protein
MQEYDEELKDNYPSEGDLHKFQKFGASPVMNKHTPSYFTDKKNSVDFSKILSSGVSPRNNNFFTNNFAEHLSKLLN